MAHANKKLVCLIMVLPTEAEVQRTASGLQQEYDDSKFVTQDKYYKLADKQVMVTNHSRVGNQPLWGKTASPPIRRVTTGTGKQVTGKTPTAAGSADSGWIAAKTGRESCPFTVDAPARRRADAPPNGVEPWTRNDWTRSAGAAAGPEGERGGSSKGGVLASLETVENVD